MDNQEKMQKQLIDELGLGNLPRDKQQEVVIKMTEILLKRIFLGTMNKLGNQGRVEYEKIVEQGASPEKIEDFLKSNIHNYEEMIQKVIEDFKEEMKKDIK